MSWQCLGTPATHTNTLLYVSHCVSVWSGAYFCLCPEWCLFSLALLPHVTMCVTHIVSQCFLLPYTHKNIIVFTYISICIYMCVSTHMYLCFSLWFLPFPFFFLSLFFLFLCFRYVRHNAMCQHVVGPYLWLPSPTFASFSVPYLSFFLFFHFSLFFFFSIFPFFLFFFFFFLSFFACFRLRLPVLVCVSCPTCISVWYR